mgnify:CR=1 FL=1
MKLWTALFVVSFPFALFRSLSEPIWAAATAAYLYFAIPHLEFFVTEAPYAALFWAVAILTMVIGSVIALTQTDIKRMLAYSSIAHAGFILTGFVGLHAVSSFAGNEISSVQANDRSLR